MEDREWGGLEGGGVGAYSKPGLHLDYMQRSTRKQDSNDLLSNDLLSNDLLSNDLLSNGI